MCGCGEARQLRGSAHERAGNARRHEIEHVVELRGSSADVRVALILVTHHRVERVDGLIERSGRRSAQRHEQQRRDNAIRHVLGNGLDCGLRNAFLVERFRVTADDHAHGLARSWQIACFERIVNFHALIAQ